MGRIVIVQPYVPAYRVPFFEQLGARFAHAGHELVVVSGRPLGQQRKRRDAANLIGVRHETFTPKVLRVGPLAIRVGPTASAWSGADVVVVELAAGSAVTYRALLGRIPTAVWGHVGSYVARDRLPLRLLRAWQVRHADQVLAYTASGGATAARYGAALGRVAVLRNTVDIEPLRALVLATKERPDADVRGVLGVGHGPVFSTIGGLDESKRVDLIAMTLDVLWREDPAIKVLVGGRGHLEHLLEPARLRGQVILLGHVNDDQKALMARISIAIFNPGRVGLIAVESFVLGLPIVTAERSLHGPEFEYLSPGKDSLVVAGDPEVLAATLVSLATEGALPLALSVAAQAKADQYRLTEMVDTMYRALVGLLGADLE